MFQNTKPQQHRPKFSVAPGKNKKEEQSEKPSKRLVRSFLTQKQHLLLQPSPRGQREKHQIPCSLASSTARFPVRAFGSDWDREKNGRFSSDTKRKRHGGG